MTDPDLFSFRLRHVREERGMSQRALASGICSPSAISRWESGQSVPSIEVITKLANRLGLSVEVLITRDLNSRLLVSDEDFGYLVKAIFGEGKEASEGGTMASWISRVKLVVEQSDLWVSSLIPRQMVDDLSVDPLTASSPSALETIELLDAIVRVQEAQDHSAVEQLTDTLCWAVDAPRTIRKVAVETVVALLVSIDMPIAAHDALVRINPPDISATTEVLLTWDTNLIGKLPPISSMRTARDVAFRILSHARMLPKPEGQQLATTVTAICPNDSLVRLWASKVGGTC